MKRQALGRGISALIPTSSTAAAIAAEPSAGRNYFICPIERIRPQADQPRRVFDEQRLVELAASIREQGIVQPLLVRKTKDGDFQLIAGERRWRAAQKAGLHEVPVVVRDATALEAFELALVENLQREDLNPLEEAESYQRLIDEHAHSQEQIAAKLGRDRSTIANALRLLKLPEALRQDVAVGTLSPGHARAILGLEQRAEMLRVAKEVQAKQLSVRQTEQLVKALKKGPAAAAAVRSPLPQKSANVRDLERRLSYSLKTKVEVNQKRGKSGCIEIHYSSLDELDRLLEDLLT